VAPGLVLTLGDKKYHPFPHSFSILSDDRSKASSKMMPPYSAIQSLLLQMRIFSPVLKVIHSLLGIKTTRNLQGMELVCQMSSNSITAFDAVKSKSLGAIWNFSNGTGLP